MTDFTQSTPHARAHLQRIKDTTAKAWGIEPKPLSEEEWAILYPPQLSPEEWKIHDRLLMESAQ